MVTRLLALLLLWAAESLHAAGCSVLYRKDAGGASVVSMTAGNKSLSEREALDCFRAFVARETKQIRLRSVVIYGDARDQACCRFKMDEVRNFNDWLEAVAAAHKVQGAMAEIVQSAAGMVLRHRSVNGQVSKTVVEGQDPTEVRVGRWKYEILRTVVMGPVPAFEHKPGGGYRLDVFLQTDAPLRERDCLRVTQDLGRDLDVPLVIADFRRDPFFILSDEYPALHPLIKLPPLPTEQEYLADGEIGCQVEYGKSWCLFWPKPAGRSPR